MKPESASSQMMSPGKAPTLARAATLAQVAQQAGVSPVAVSVVLNNARSQVRVSAQTRQRIIDAARELNYQPNALTRSLRKRRTDIIGFYSAQGKMFDPQYPFYGALLKGMLEGCEQHHKNFLVHGTFAEVSEDAIYRELLNGQIDGLIFYTRGPSSLTERLVKSHLPVVTVADEVPGVPCVSVDNQECGRLMAHFLAERNFRRILYWVADMDLSAALQLRADAFCAEAARQKMEVELFHPHGAWPHEEDIARIFSRPQRPQVIAAFNDSRASHIVSWCARNGVRVPQDVAVTGFDGFFAEPSRITRISTVRLPWDEVARTAVSLLVKQCQGEEVPMKTVLPVELLLGNSA